MTLLNASSAAAVLHPAQVSGRMMITSALQPLLKAWRFVADTRDESAAERLAAVNGENGLWRCHLIFNCMEACPKEIDIPQPSQN